MQLLNEIRAGPGHLADELLKYKANTSRTSGQQEENKQQKNLAQSTDPSGEKKNASEESDLQPIIYDDIGVICRGSVPRTDDCYGKY